MGTVDEYLSGLDDQTRALFQHLLDVAAEVVADTGQGTSYGMAAVTYDGKPLLALVRQTGHLSLFPFSGRVVEAVAERLPGFSMSKGTIRFSLEQPVPDDVMREVVRLRAAEISGSRRR